jgi:hypothetical protein
MDITDNNLIIGCSQHYDSTNFTKAYIISYNLDNYKVDKLFDIDEYHVITDIKIYE